MRVFFCGPVARQECRVTNTRNLKCMYVTCIGEIAYIKLFTKDFFIIYKETKARKEEIRQKQFEQNRHTLKQHKNKRKYLTTRQSPNRQSP